MLLQHIENKQNKNKQQIKAIKIIQTIEGREYCVEPFLSESQAFHNELDQNMVSDIFDHKQSIIVEVKKKDEEIVKNSPKIVENLKNESVSKSVHSIDKTFKIQPINNAALQSNTPMEGVNYGFDEPTFDNKQPCYSGIVLESALDLKKQNEDVEMQKYSKSDIDDSESHSSEKKDEVKATVLVEKPQEHNWLSNIRSSMNEKREQLNYPMKRQKQSENESEEVLKVRGTELKSIKESEEIAEPDQLSAMQSPVGKSIPKPIIYQQPQVQGEEKIDESSSSPEKQITSKSSPSKPLTKVFHNNLLKGQNIIMNKNKNFKVDDPIGDLLKKQKQAKKATPTINGSTNNQTDNSSMLNYTTKKEVYNKPQITKVVEKPNAIQATIDGPYPKQDGENSDKKISVNLEGINIVGTGVEQDMKDPFINEFVNFEQNQKEFSAKNSPAKTPNKKQMSKIELGSKSPLMNIKTPQPVKSVTNTMHQPFPPAPKTQKLQASAAIPIESFLPEYPGMFKEEMQNKLLLPQAETQRFKPQVPVVETKPKPAAKELEQPKQTFKSAQATKNKQVQGKKGTVVDKVKPNSKSPPPIKKKSTQNNQAVPVEPAKPKLGQSPQKQVVKNQVPMPKSFQIQTVPKIPAVTIEKVTVATSASVSFSAPAPPKVVTQSAQDILESIIAKQPEIVPKTVIQPSKPISFQAQIVKPVIVSAKSVKLVPLVKPVTPLPVVVTAAAQSIAAAPVPAPVTMIQKLVPITQSVQSVAQKLESLKQNDKPSPAPPKAMVTATFSKSAGAAANKALLPIIDNVVISAAPSNKMVASNVAFQKVVSVTAAAPANTTTVGNSVPTGGRSASTGAKITNVKQNVGVTKTTVFAPAQVAIKVTGPSSVSPGSKPPQTFKQAMAAQKPVVGQKSEVAKKPRQAKSSPGAAAKPATIFQKPAAQALNAAKPVAQAPASTAGVAVEAKPKNRKFKKAVTDFADKFKGMGFNNK